MLPAKRRLIGLSPIAKISVYNDPYFSALIDHMKIVVSIALVCLSFSFRLVRLNVPCS
jgi:hypothetical protein